MLAALLLPVLLSLGNWQLSRAEQKQQIKTELKNRQFLPPVPVSEIMGEKDIRYRAVFLQGKYDNDRTFLLDNRVKNGRVGYEVISPFILADEKIVLVNRGWIAAPKLRSELPTVPAVERVAALTGMVYRPFVEAQKVSADVSQDEWPRVVQSVNFAEIAKQLGKSIPSFTVRLNEGVAGSLLTGWPTVNVEPRKHIGYAVQWFAMALALFILTLIANSNFSQILKTKNNERVDV